MYLKGDDKAMPELMTEKLFELEKADKIGHFHLLFF
jgi:hypothetical protein